MNRRRYINRDGSILLANSINPRISLSKRRDVSVMGLNIQQITHADRANTLCSGRADGNFLCNVAPATHCADVQDLGVSTKAPPPYSLFFLRLFSPDYPWLPSLAPVGSFALFFVSVIFTLSCTVSFVTRCGTRPPIITLRPFVLTLITTRDPRTPTPLSHTTGGDGGRATSRESSPKTPLLELFRLPRAYSLYRYLIKPSIIFRSPIRRRWNFLIIINSCLAPYNGCGRARKRRVLCN